MQMMQRPDEFTRMQMTQPSGPVMPSQSMRLWIEQEVDANVRASLRELACDPRDSAAAQKLAAQDARQQQFADLLITLEKDVHRQGVELRQWRQQGSAPGPVHSGTHRMEGGVVRELFVPGSRQSSRQGSPARSPECDSAQLMKLPGLRALQLNSADQARETKALADEMSQVKENFSTLRREVQTAVAAAAAARRVAEAVQVKVGTASGSISGQSAMSQEIEAAVQVAMRMSWHQLRTEVIEEALRKSRETWSHHHVAIEVLREEQQAVREHLSTFMDQQPRNDLGQDSTCSVLDQHAQNHLSQEGTRSEKLWDQVLERVRDGLEERHQEEPILGGSQRDAGNISGGARGMLGWDPAQTLAKQLRSRQPASENFTADNAGRVYDGYVHASWSGGKADDAASPLEPNAEDLVAQLDAHHQSSIIENVGEFTLGLDESPEVCQYTHDKSRTPAKNADAYANVLTRLHHATNEIETSVRSPPRSPEGDEGAEPAPAAHKGCRSARKASQRLRPASRWQVGKDFSSDSDSADGRDLLEPFGSVPTHSSRSTKKSEQAAGPEASKRSGALAKQGRWANAARARLGFSSDSDAG